MIYRWISLASGLFFLVLGSLVIFFSQKLPGGIGISAAEPGPGLFPMMVGAILFAASFLHLIETLRSKERNEDIVYQIPKDLIFMILTIALYIFLLPRAGFFIAAFLLLIGSLSIFEMAGWTKRIASSLLATVLSYAIFTSVLNVKMPNPSWFS